MQLFLLFVGHKEVMNKLYTVIWFVQLNRQQDNSFDWILLSLYPDSPFIHRYLKIIF